MTTDTFGTIGFLSTDNLPQEPLYIRRHGEVMPAERIERNFDVVPVHNIPIRDIRSMAHPPSLQREGFMIDKRPSKMCYEDYYNEQKLKDVFARELKQQLQEIFQPKYIFLHECVVG